MAVSVEEYIRNPIKRHIIGEIMKKGKLRYSELMPPDTDNVLFNYHLQHLVKSGLLCKEDNIYSFTPEGWKATSHVTYDGIYFQRFVVRSRMYVINNNQILLHERVHSPFKGATTGLSNKLVYGTPAVERARLRLQEKTGINAVLQLAGTVRVVISDADKEILDDSILFVMYATSYKGELKQVDDGGNPLSWYSFDEAIKLEKANPWTGDKSVEVLQRFKEGNFDPFIFEEYITAASL